MSGMGAGKDVFNYLAKEFDSIVRNLFQQPNIKIYFLINKRFFFCNY